MDPSYVVSVKLDEASDVRNYGKMSVVETVLENSGQMSLTLVWRMSGCFLSGGPCGGILLRQAVHGRTSYAYD